jgi:predicted O-methyltransferase YrrM
LADKGFQVHSPFVYDFYTKVIKGDGPANHSAFIEKHRSHLHRQKSLLETTDFGSGSAHAAYKTRFRKVNEVARHSSVNPKMGKLLYRLAVFSGAKNILEIGTAMGISTMYLASAAPESRLVSIEGCAVIAQKALDGFKKYKLENIELVQGNFNKYLPEVLATFDTLDMVFIDGNHKEKPTIKYFNETLSKIHPGSIIVIDDIHWSKGMGNAWKEIAARPEVSISIDIFRAGILLFREGIPKQHFRLKF